MKIAPFCTLGLFTIISLVGCSDRKAEIERRVKAELEQREIQQKAELERKQIELQAQQLKEAAQLATRATLAEAERLRRQKELIEANEQRLKNIEESNRQKALAEAEAQRLKEEEIQRQKELAEEIQRQKEIKYADSLNLKLLTNGNIQLTVDGIVVDAYKFTMSHNTTTGDKSINVHCNKGIKSITYSEMVATRITELNSSIIDKQIRRTTINTQKTSSTDEAPHNYYKKSRKEEDDPAKRYAESKRIQQEQARTEAEANMRRKGYHQELDGSWQPPHGSMRPSSTVRGGW